MRPCFPADVPGQLFVQFANPVQDVAVATLLLRVDALAENLPTAFVEANAFDLRAPQVDADAKHARSSKLDGKEASQFAGRGKIDWPLRVRHTPLVRCGAAGLRFQER